MACPKPATCLPLVTRVHYSTYLYNTNILICSGLKQQPAVATKSLQEIVSKCGNRNIHFGSFKVGNSWLGSTLFSFVGTGSPIAFFASLRVPCSTHTASYSTQIPRTESAQDVPPTSWDYASWGQELSDSLAQGFLVCSQGSLDVQTQHVQQLACLPARYVNTIQHICQHNSCSRPTCDSDGMPASKVLWHQSGWRGVSAASSTLWRVTSLQYPGVTPQLSHMALQCATVCHGDWMKDD